MENRVFHAVVWTESALAVSDPFRVEEAYAAACAAREVMAMVMGRRIDNGDLDLEAAERLCRFVFHDNAKGFFDI